MTIMIESLSADAKRMKEKNTHTTPTWATWQIKGIPC